MRYSHLQKSFPALSRAKPTPTLRDMKNKQTLFIFLLSEIRYGEI